MRLLSNPLVLILFAFAVAVAAPAADYHPTRLIVKLKPGHSFAKSTALTASVNAASWQPLYATTQHAQSLDPFSRIGIAEFGDPRDCERARTILAGAPSVEFAEPDYYMQLFSDPLFINQWGLVNEGQEFLGIRRIPGNENDSLLLFRGSPGADIHWGQVQSAPTEHSRVKVAIIDTGVDFRHPDLQGNIWRNRAEVGGVNGYDDDFNGYVDDTVGYDFSGDVITGISVSPDADPTDTIGHGTHVAGIVGAVAGNGIGIEGVARNVELMCLKIFPNALASASAKAIVYAVDNGAKVINASWGSPFYSSVVAEAVQYATAHGVIFVAAAGNSGTSSPFFPARFEEVFTVGATNARDRVTTFSTYGDWVDVCAPGENILSLRAARTDLYAGQGEPGIRIIDNDYYLADGTSMASPHVAGAAAFLLSIAPGLARDSIQNLLIASADKIADPSGTLQGVFSPYAGWGRINLERAAGFLQGSYADIESPAPHALMNGAIAFRGSAVSPAPAFLLEVRPASAGEWMTVATGTPSLVRSLLANWDSSPFDGLTDVRLRVGDYVAYTMSVRLANNRIVELLSPAEGDTVYSVASIVGSATSPTFRSYKLTFAPFSNPKQETLIVSSNTILYRAELAEWTVGQIPPGRGFIKLTLLDAEGEHSISREVEIKSALAAGYPRNLHAHVHLTSVAGNLDRDPVAEIVTGTRTGLAVTDYNDSRLVMLDTLDHLSHESSPALYDFDGDGRDEIVSVTSRGITIVDADGVPLSGWPKVLLIGNQFNAFPTPLVTDIDGDEQMEILLVNIGGEIYCWHADGTSYFRTRDGLFARVAENGLYRNFGGAVPAFLFAFDFDGDGYQDVGAIYTSLGGVGGVYLYSGKTGGPLYRDRGAQVFGTDGIFGGILADFDNDGVPEIAFAHWYSSNLAMGVHIIEADGTVLPGWPKLFPNRTNWLTPYPAAADLDRDSVPELVCVFSAIDGGEVFAWHGDGTAFLSSEFGRNDGFLARTINSLASPLIVDIDNDGQLEIVARGGSLFLGKPERILSFELDGSETPGWPHYTFTDPARVLYSPFTPVAGDFDGDGLLELFISSADSIVYAWDLPTIDSDSAIAWGTFLGNQRNTGLLPSLAQRQTPQPPALPTSFRLAQNYPNPFNQNTVIEIDVTESANVKVEIINVLGQTVTTLLDKFLPPGAHRLEWDGRDDHGHDLASGVYFYRLRMNQVTETRRMVLLK